MTKKHDVFTMPIGTLKKQIAELIAALDEVENDLDGLVHLTSEERVASGGKFRSGEADALLSVLSAAENRPELFESLADKDFGTDDEVFETQVLRDRLERAAVLLPLSDRLDALNTRISDTMLALSAETKPVMLQAYGIAKSIAKTDAKLRTMIAKAVDFYGHIARRAAETRRKNHDKKA